MVEVNISDFTNGILNPVDRFHIPDHLIWCFFKGTAEIRFQLTNAMGK
jgi:hypothetical protein